MISFILSAYIVCAMAIICYVFNLLPPYLLNDYDRNFVKRAAYPHDLITFYEACADGMLAFSDTQVLQGNAILISAFANVGEMTVYDWTIIVFLAWCVLSWKAS